MLCGSSQRNITTFFPPGYNFAVVNSCTPDAQTQAMLVSRSFGNAINQATLQSYLNAGGIVLTEWSISHLVWTQAFAATVQGTNNGACWDTAPTVVQFTPGDKMWTKVPFMAIPNNQSGCGYSVTNYPGITPLAGWAIGQTSIGYRDLGAGRLWATDFDWQDNEGYPYAYTNTLMGYFITHRK